MNEFEDFLKQNYGLKDGDEVSEDVYEKASAEFLQSRSTVPSINPPASAFDLDKAIPDPAPEEQAPSQAATEVDETFGGLLPDQKKVFKGFWQMRKEADDLIKDTGTRDQDKAAIREELQGVVAQEWNPLFQQMGMDPADVEYKMESLKLYQQKNPEASFDEALDKLTAPRNRGGDRAAAGLADPEVVGQIKNLQQVAQTNLDQAETEADPVKRRQLIKGANDARQQIRTLNGDKDRSPYEVSEQIRQAREEIARKNELGAGTVVYDGVRVGRELFDELDRDLANEEADALDLLQRDRSSLRVGLQAAAVPMLGSDGKPKADSNGKVILDPDKTKAKYEELLAGAKPGEIVEFPDGSVGRFTPAEVKKQKAAPVPVEVPEEIREMEAQLRLLPEDSPEAARLRTKLGESKISNTIKTQVLPGVKEGLLKIVPPPETWAQLGRDILAGAKAIR